jgi:hypothetical protein
VSACSSEQALSHWQWSADCALDAGRCQRVTPPLKCTLNHPDGMPWMGPATESTVLCNVPVMRGIARGARRTCQPSIYVKMAHPEDQTFSSGNEVPCRTPMCRLLVEMNPVQVTAAYGPFYGRMSPLL